MTDGQDILLRFEHLTGMSINDSDKEILITLIDLRIKRVKAEADERLYREQCHYEMLRSDPNY